MNVNKSPFSILDVEKFIQTIYSTLETIDFSSQSLYFENNELKARDDKPTCLPRRLIKVLRYIGFFKRPECENIQRIFYLLADCLIFSSNHKQAHLKALQNSDFDAIKNRFETLKNKVTHKPGCGPQVATSAIQELTKLFQEAHPQRLSDNSISAPFGSLHS